MKNENQTLFKVLCKKPRFIEASCKRPAGWAPVHATAFSNLAPLIDRLKPIL
jgi:hypothetical protein